MIFIAFCEDRRLLPQKTIATRATPTGIRATNPQWQSFKNLFRDIDEGELESESAEIATENNRIPKYNGGLFALHPVDDIELPHRLTTFLKTIGEFDFANEVNLEVLGHLFERSITELERLKSTGILGDAEKSERYAQMPQSVKRKQLGIYYTPPELTSLIVKYTVEELIDERFAALAVKLGTNEADAKRGLGPDTEKFWRGCLDILRNLKVVDPACGSGAFLFQAYNTLEGKYLDVITRLEHLDAAGAEELGDQIPHFILEENLYGVDLSREAVEITQLALWIRSATRGQTLATLSRNIVHGNSLVHDPKVDDAGFDWKERFPEVFSPRLGSTSSKDFPPPLDGEGPGEGGVAGLSKTPHPNPLPKGEGTGRQPGFDCVIGNPPWERIKLQEREFFSLPAPEIATATNAAKRRQLVAKLESDDPQLFGRYQKAIHVAENLLRYCRKLDEYPLTGKGDINLYAVFVELASQLVAPQGRVGMLTPSGIAMHNTTKDFFGSISTNGRLIKLYDFDNRLGTFFPDVHPDTQFSILNFGGTNVNAEQPDYIFGVMKVEEIEDRKRHVTLTGTDIQLLNPNTRTCPIFRTRRDAEITKAVYCRVPVLVDSRRKGPTKNPWEVSFKRMFDQTNDAELFQEAAALKADGYKLKGNRWEKGKRVFLPLYEAKMIRSYDHRFGTVFEEVGNWINQGQTIETTEVQHANPEFVVLPRFWANKEAVDERASPAPCRLAFRDITNPTNRRTMISGFAPSVGFINTLPIIEFDESVPIRLRACLQANFGGFVFDYVARNKMQGRHMNFYILEQLPTLPPDTYAKPCPWSNKGTTLEKWISERVLKLTCTAEDMLPLAEACDFTGGSFKREYGGRLHKWDEAERAELMAELDAAYFHLYGIDRDDAEYILSTFKGIHDDRPLLASGESTAELILAKFDAFVETA
jgi:hypothetical protein